MKRCGIVAFELEDDAQLGALVGSLTMFRTEHPGAEFETFLQTDGNKGVLELLKSLLLAKQ